MKEHLEEECKKVKREVDRAKNEVRREKDELSKHQGVSDMDTRAKDRLLEELHDLED